MSTVSRNASTHLFWVLSRGAGTTALILASASVGFGLLMSRSGYVLVVVAMLLPSLSAQRLAPEPR